MTSLDGRIDALRKLSPGRRLGAIAEAARGGSEDDLERLGPELIELALVPPRASSSRQEVAAGALVEVVHLWRRLSPCLRRTALAAGRGRWEEPLRKAATETDPASRFAAAKVAQETGDAGLAPLLADLLGDSDPRVASAAGVGLLRLCVRAAGVADRRLLGPDAPPEVFERPLDAGAPDATGAADGLAGLVARCMAGASIRRTRLLALCALVLLPRPFEAERLGPGRARLASEVRAADDHAGMRAALRRSSAPLARLHALWWLSDRAVAAGALERLARTETPAEHEVSLRARHLLLRPSRRSRVRRVQVRTRPVERADGPPTRAIMPGGAVPDAAALGRLTGAARAGLPAFVSALSPDDAVRSGALAPLVTDPDPWVRFAAVRCAPPSDLADYCLDPDPNVARTAVLAWSAVGLAWSGPRPSDAARRRLAGRLCLSPHRSVRLIAAGDRERLDPFDPDSGGSRLAALRMLATEPEELSRALLGVLTQPAEAPRLRALRVVRRLGMHGRVLDALLTIAAGGAGATDREVATAVSALGDAGAPESVEETLVACLSHADARVRANAVEALGRRARRRGAAGRSAAGDQGGGVEGLVELKSDGHHRVRANAVRGMVASQAAGDGASALDEMLRDGRAGHRLAAVWLASRVLTVEPRSAVGGQWTSLAVRIAELAREDADARVRRRAVACAARVRMVVASVAGRGGARL